MQSTAPEGDTLLRKAKGRKVLENIMNDLAKNVLGGVLQPCSIDPMTGFFRTGDCQVTEEDIGNHGVCIVASAEFLDFSKTRGNDLSTPHREFGFPGLKPGDRWCLCSARWQEALEAGMAPPVVLEATSSASLEVVRLADLKRYAVKLDQER
jgi:uncharacterized protein (DUF2237 family)